MVERNLLNAMDQVCRTCLKLVKNSLAHELGSTATTAIPIREMILFCVPELTLDTATNSVICDTCYNCLQGAYDFKRRCLETEKLILSESAIKIENPDECSSEFVKVEDNVISDYSQDIDVKEIKDDTAVKFTELNSSLERNNGDLFTCERVNENVTTDTTDSSQEGYFKCAFCLVTFFNPKDKVFISYVEKIRGYVCNKCKNEGRVARLKRPQKFECRICNEFFYVERHLLDHVAIHTEMGFSCDVCKSKFKSMFHLLVHENLHCPEQNITSTIKTFCKVCRTQFISTNCQFAWCNEQLGKSLNFKKKRKRWAVVYQCDVCRKLFLHKSHYTKHKTIH